MKLVVLDGYTLNPGDLNWEGIKKFGDLEVHDRTPESLIVERCQGAEIIFTNKTPLREAVLSQLPDLKYIGVLATGYNVVDVDYAKSQGHCSGERTRLWYSISGSNDLCLIIGIMSACTKPQRFGSSG
jgi:lactate dehydrogenase-like 2-hydroxyacid dehydrogenase